MSYATRMQPGGPRGRWTAPATSLLLAIALLGPACGEGDEPAGDRPQGAPPTVTVEMHAETLEEDTSGGPLPPEDRASVPALREALADPSANKRSAAAYHLGMLGPAASAAAPDLEAALADPAGSARVAAALALARVSERHDAAVATLRDVLRRGGQALRIEAALALGDLGEQAAAAVPELVEQAKGTLERTGDPIPYDEGPVVEEPGYLGITDRSAAAEALGRIGTASDDVLAALEALAAEGEPDEVDTAKQALAILAAAR